MFVNFTDIIIASYHGFKSADGCKNVTDLTAIFSQRWTDTQKLRSFKNDKKKIEKKLKKKKTTFCVRMQLNCKAFIFNADADND